MLEIWSNGRLPLPLASRSQVGGTSSVSAGETLKKQGKLTNPYKLSEGHHAIHLCPYMNEAKRVLDNLVVFAPCLPAGYKQLSLSPPPADPMIGQESSLVDPAPSKIQIQESIIDQPLVVGSVELAPSAVHQVFSNESGPHIPRVLLVSSDSSDLEKDSPAHVPQEVSPSPSVMKVLEDNPPTFEMEVVEDAPSSVTSGEDHLGSMVAPPISLVASFDCNRFA